MEICVLGSGSKGNCTFIKTETCSFLVDAGLSARQTKLRLEKMGQDPNDIDFILLTHEHTDHVAGVDRIVKLYGPSVLANRGTFEAMRPRAHVRDNYTPLTTRHSITHKGVNITPVPVSHNASDPVGYIIEHNGKRAAVTTDLGFVSKELVEVLTGLDAWLVESNYDHEMLLEGPYPLHLKKRISGLSGHLSNKATGEAILRVDPGPDTHLFLTHLSEKNNHPDLAYSRVREIMERGGLSGKNIMVCLQREPSACIRI